MLDITSFRYKHKACHVFLSYIGVLERDAPNARQAAFRRAAPCAGAP